MGSMEVPRKKAKKYLLHLLSFHLPSIYLSPPLSLFFSRCATCSYSQIFLKLTPPSHSKSSICHSQFPSLPPQPPPTPFSISPFSLNLHPLQFSLSPLSSANPVSSPFSFAPPTFHLTPPPCRIVVEMINVHELTM